MLKKLLSHWLNAALLVFATAGALWFLLDRAWNPGWLGHLRIDPLVYHARAEFFHEHGSWAGLGFNEYQPGALWFFAAVGVAAGGLSEFDDFLRALMAVNCVILAAHVLLAGIFGGRFAPWLMLALAAACGPILLFRFELFVSLLVISGWLLWRSGRLAAAGALLGFAVSAKLYPVLLGPLFLIDAWRLGRWPRVATGLAGWGMGLALPILALFAFGTRPSEVMDALRYHFDKPVGIDGFQGSLIPVLQELFGIPLRNAPRNGIYGFDSDLGIAAGLIAWLWLPLVLAVMFFTWRKSGGKAWPEPAALFVIFGIYVGLGKLMAPQYVWWAVPFLAFASPGVFSVRQILAISTPLLAALAISQIVYPLNYTEFIESFSGQPLANRLFWINATKNVLWLLSIVLAAVFFLRSPKKPLIT
jgi:hypothetical protein